MFIRIIFLISHKFVFIILADALSQKNNQCTINDLCGASNYIN